MTGVQTCALPILKVLYTPTQIPEEEKINKDNEVYEVDRILDHREKDGVFKYHIKWKGYGKKDATWETEDHINDPQPVEKYFRLWSLKQQARRVKVNVLATSESDSCILQVSSKAIKH